MKARSKHFMILSFAFASTAIAQNRPAPTPPPPQQAPVLQNAAGARAYQQQCRSCHTLKTGERNQAGPNLSGFMGKRLGAANLSFRYSAAFKNNNQVWNDTLLDQLLKSPARTIPGTSMSVPGIAQDSTRASLIDYLKRETVGN
jgi:cytochrome c